MYWKVNLGCAFKATVCNWFILKYQFQNPSDRIQTCKKANGFRFFFHASPQTSVPRVFYFSSRYETQRKGLIALRQQQMLHCNYDSDIFMTANYVHLTVGGSNIHLIFQCKSKQFLSDRDFHFISRYREITRTCSKTVLQTSVFIIMTIHYNNMVKKEHSKQLCTSKNNWKQMTPDTLNLRMVMAVLTWKIRRINIQNYIQLL